MSPKYVPCRGLSKMRAQCRDGNQARVTRKAASHLSHVGQVEGNGDVAESRTARTYLDSQDGR
jgi:hypothetical protein